MVAAGGSPTAAVEGEATEAMGKQSDQAADQDWDSLHIEKCESRDAAQAGAEQDSASAGGVNASKYGLDDAARNARLFFYEEGSEEALSFRDVVLRSRALEHLVNSYVATPVTSAAGMGAHSSCTGARARVLKHPTRVVYRYTFLF